MRQIRYKTLICGTHMHQCSLVVIRSPCFNSFLQIAILMSFPIHLGISFVILAIYWVAHHRQFRYTKQSNRVLIWINIMFLMATCLVPFPTSLLGEYREQEISILVYGGNSIVIASVLYIQWRYVTTSRHGKMKI